MQSFQNEANRIDWNKIEAYLHREIPGLSQNPINIRPFSEGYSNLTYFISIGDWEAVLRRPPFGPLPPKAHDMKREYDILEKLNRVFPLAPKPYLYCDDPSIMERHFYVMEKKDGVVLDDKLPEEFQSIPDVGRIISNGVVDTLVQLHSVDYASAGLSSIGYPDGYLTRQVHGWIKRHKNSKTEEISSAESIEKWLLENIPLSPEPTIVHNDFKLNNLMFSKKGPGKVVGVFDWELSTIGDPLTDIASTIAYWQEAEEEDTGISAITTGPGFFSRRELLEAYVQKSSRDLSNFDFYLTFAFYKIAGILMQIYYRWKIGEAKDERFGKLDAGIKNLLRLAEKAQRNELLR